MATVQTKPAAAAAKRGGPRRIRVTVRKVNPWSVLKLSLVFYFCLLLIVLSGLAILFMLLDAMGLIDSIAGLLTGLTILEPSAEIRMFPVFRVLFLIGFITVIVGSVFTTFLAFLYNLLSDLVGGIEVTLLERR